MITTDRSPLLPRSFPKDQASSSYASNKVSPQREVSRLESSEDWLNRYITDHVIDHQQPPETLSHKATRIALCGAAIILGMIGNMTFKNIAGEPARHEDGVGFNEPYRWTLIVSNALSFGILTSWALLKLANQAVKVQSESEKQILLPEPHKALRITAKTAAVITGLVSQIPFGYMAYKYNNNNIPFAVAIIASNFGYPAYSLDLTFKAALAARDYTEEERKYQDVRLKILGRLEEMKAYFLSMSKEEKLAFINQIENTEPSSRSYRTKFETYLELLLQKEIPARTPPNSLLMKAGKIACAVTGLALSATTLSHNWMGGYSGTEELLDAVAPNMNETAAEAIEQTAAAIITASSVYLTVNLISQSISSLFEDSVQVARRQYTPPISFQLMPKTTAALKAISLGLAGTCWGAAVQFSRDYFSGPGGKVIEIGSSVANAILVNSAMMATVDEAVMLYSAYKTKGNGDERKIAGMFRDLDSFASKVKESSIKNFALALHTWISILGEDWAEQYGIDSDDLRRYLRENKLISRIRISSTNSIYDDDVV